MSYNTFSQTHKTFFESLRDAVARPVERGGLNLSLKHFSSCVELPDGSYFAFSFENDNPDAYWAISFRDDKRGRFYELGTIQCWEIPYDEHRNDEMRRVFRWLYSQYYPNVLQGD